MDPRDLADELVETAVRATAIDIRAFEERDLAALRADLLPEVLEVLEHGLSAVGKVLEDYEREHVADLEETLANFYVKVDRVLKVEASRSPVADLAFMARMELGERHRVLRAADRGWDRWYLLGECDGALRRVRKAAAAVERALAAHAGFDPRLELVSETSWGRLIRSYYARFRREIEGDGVPADGEIHARLQSAATAIARLVRRDIYRELRVSDRAGLRGVQERLQAWLGGADGFDPDSGRSIWHDLWAFSMLLAQVNRRSELVDHDRIVVTEALAVLEATGDSADRVPSSLLVHLESLTGLRDSIDELLKPPVTRERAPWLRELRHLQTELGGPSRGAEPPDRDTDFEW